jgi:uracil phosphoribosyltransferase
MNSKKNLNLVTHPIVQEIITTLRDIETPPELFRIELKRLSQFLLYEALKDLNTKGKNVPTQTGINYTGHAIKDHVAFISILRASLGMLTTAMEFYPSAEFHVLGMKRNEEDPKNVEPHFYLDRLGEMSNKVNRIVVMDPMLATGGSMLSAINAIRKKHNFKKKINIVAIIAAKTGTDLLFKHHPDITITCAGFDQRLNDKAYIIPGLGDAGDRYFGLKSNLGDIR